MGNNRHFWMYKPPRGPCKTSSQRAFLPQSMSVFQNYILQSNKMDYLFHIPCLTYSLSLDDHSYNNVATLMTRLNSRIFTFTLMGCHVLKLAALPHSEIVLKQSSAKNSKHKDECCDSKRRNITARPKLIVEELQSAMLICSYYA